MAYNDYGSFIFKNGIRRHDKEDAAVFGSEELLKFGNGSRIYARIIGEMSGRKYEPWETPVHGVLGDGNVRLALYKTGIEMARVYSRNPETGEIASYGVDDFLHMCGIDRGEYPSDWDENWTKEEKQAHFDACDAYWAHTKGGYDLSFEIGGAKFHLDWQPVEENCDDEDSVNWAKSADIHKGRFHATLDDVDGSHWECNYGSCYGAGWTDVDAFGYITEAFEHLDENGHVPECKVFSVCEETFEGEKADMNVIYDATGNVMVVSFVEGMEGDDGYIRTPKMGSTLGYGSSYIDLDSFVQILNMGIALGRQGYTAVDKNHSIFTREDDAPHDAYEAVFSDDEESEKLCIERYKIDEDAPDQLDLMRGIVDFGRWKIQPFEQLRCKTEDEEASKGQHLP